MHGIYSNSTVDEKTHTLYTKVINLGHDATEGTLHLCGGHATKATCTRLAAAQGSDENTEREPLMVAPPSREEVTQVPWPMART